MTGASLVWPQQVGPLFFYGGVGLMAIGAAIALWRAVRSYRIVVVRVHATDQIPTRHITQEFVGQTFENETLVLDGRRYIDCTFRNCTFVWNGGAWEVRHWKRIGQFRWKTSWQPALETITQLKALDILGDPDFAATWAHPDSGTALATLDERHERERNRVAAERLRMLRAVAVHFLKVGNRLPYLGSTKQQEDIFRARGLAQLGTWETMVMELRPETHGADNEWDRFKVLGNMAVPDVIAEKIDRLDTLIAKLTQG